MSNEPKIEIRNKQGFFGVAIKNDDGSPVQEVVEGGKPVQEIRNKEAIGGTVRNADGTPVKVVLTVPRASLGNAPSPVLHKP